MCSLIVINEQSWFHLKILIFGLVMSQKVFKNTNYSIYGHTFLAITQPFLANRAENVFGNSGDYHL